MRNSKGSKEYLHPGKQVNPKVGKNDFRNSEGAMHHLRNSNIILDVGLTSSNYGNLTPQKCGVNMLHDFGSNRIRIYGKCCPPWTTDDIAKVLYKIYNESNNC